MSTKEASRRSPLHDEWAVKVKTRAGWKCEWCGLTADQIRELGGQLEAAHIAPWQEYPEKRFDPANGKALCTFRNRRHPKGLGNGYGCHNAMSGHWGHSYGKVPVHHPGGFWHKVGVLVLSVPLWWAFVIADVDLRYYWAWSRHFTFGQATTIGGMFTLLLGLVALWGACLILCHLALRRRWLGRGGRGLLHALLRLAKMGEAMTWLRNWLRERRGFCGCCGRGYLFRRHQPDPFWCSACRRHVLPFGCGLT